MTKTLNQNTFTGEFSYSLDSKGRLNIPAKFRNVLSKKNKDSFVITKGMDPCIWVYPLVAWQNIEDELKNITNKEIMAAKIPAIDTVVSLGVFFFHLRVTVNNAIR